MLSDTTLTITDPTEAKAPGLIGRLFGDMVRDQRDLGFIKLAISLLVLLIPIATLLLIPATFSWWLGAAYIGVCLWFLGPFVLMLHCTSHRVLFKRDYLRWNRIIPWVVGPFFGQTPETYFAHHMGMHHADGNLPEDLSSTMKYQRDSFIDFLKYFLDFYFLGDLKMHRYLKARKKTKLLRRFWIGELSYLALAIAVTVIHWQAGVVLFWIPFTLTRFLLMAGNWTQHAFLHPDAPDNDWKSVISFVNSKYNHRCFNDGYHLGHHIKASRHWLDMPQDFWDNRTKMIEEGTLVFRQLDYFQIWLLLMFKRHRTIAKYVVQLDPNNQRSLDELVTLLKSRVTPFNAAQMKQYAAE